ncbi:MAG: ABC transporter ATP-binding protein [Alphaproteobacteria bacterium]|nr:ABC transporter ATP-binding protein [Alphaproteobacteria bacterium]
MTPLLQLDTVTKAWRTPAGLVQAVRGVSLAVQAGETVALVGESGCGKSTLARLALRLTPVDAGRILFDGQDITHASERALTAIRPRLQMVFQDASAALNPRRTIGQAIDDPLRVHRRPNRAARVQALLAEVGLDASLASRFPHEVSGGQRQRVGIARALALDPAVVIADEPVSALDVSVRAQVINLMSSLARQRGLAMVFIGHDLAVVRHLADRIAVMHLGEIVEAAPRQRFWSQAAHPYSQALIASVPAATPAAARARGPAPLAGDLPSPLAPPPGCSFHTRCPRAIAACQHQSPPLIRLAPDHTARCHLLTHPVLDAAASTGHR